MLGPRALFILGFALVVACNGKPKAVPAAQAAPRADSSGGTERVQALPSDGPPTPAAPIASVAPIASAAPFAFGNAALGVEAEPRANSAAQAPDAGEAGCMFQTPQPFLIAAHFDSHHALGLEHQREWGSVLRKAVRYRTQQYGYVEGFGERTWNSRTPFEQVRAVTFFGVPVRIHERVASVLACVETAIRAHCAAYPYQPAVLSGARERNTYLNGEISNHVYGIAIDIDPMRNPCCGCVEPWRSNPRCKNDKSKFERMDMPKCWVEQFERFGFYWLGHDRIEDTMHFEFLADPSQIKHHPSGEVRAAR